MTHQRVAHVSLGARTDWAQTRERLEARVRAWSERAGLAALQWIRVDARTGVLIATCADADALARFHGAVVQPWLAESELVELPASVEGETIFAWPDALDDAWADLDELSDDARTDRFVRAVAAGGTVWGLHAQTWARSDIAGQVEALPFWFARELAARCVTGAWSTFTPRGIEVTPFLEQWLVGMEEDGIVAVLLPTPTHPGTIVAPLALAAAIRQARDESAAG